MNKLKGIVGIIGLIVKYSAVVMAIIKGIEVVSLELSKIDFEGDKPKESLKIPNEIE
ncbi:hypothetical protein [Flavobacterium yafengii]|uniref:hypothetical protein n=1 Tax=Flavobacterium yafengii TaxID=3041253 RepID=UPI0024A91574|nr:hypothetical protein [Flavobacterium yafengii]MDI5898745.1 hypothetical protein [Flavobacterium yafengii]